MKVGLIGAGRIGTVHGSNLAKHPQVEQLLVADVNTEAAVSLASRLEAEIADQDTIFAEADCVVIASSTDTHAELLIRAARHRLPVFCEKPIALDMETTNTAVAAIVEAKIPNQIGFQRRFDVEHQQARRIISSGALGKMYLVTSQTHDPEPPPYEYLLTSAGLYKDTFIHDIDAVRYVTGAEITQVFAHGAALVDPRLEELPDHDVGVISIWLQNGAVGSLTALRHSPYGYDVRMAIYGSEQRIGAGFGPGIALKRLDEGSEPTETFPGFIERFATAYREEMSTFIKVARGEVPSPCTVHDGLEALRVAEAATRSARLGQPITVADIS